MANTLAPRPNPPLPESEQLADAIMKLPREKSEAGMSPPPAERRHTFGVLAPLPSEQSDFESLAQSSADSENESEPREDLRMPDPLSPFPEAKRTFGMDIVPPRSPGAKNTFGMDVAPPPSPEAKYAFGIDIAPPSSPEAKNTFGMDVAPPPSPEAKYAFGIDIAPPSSPEAKKTFGIDFTPSLSPEAKKIFGINIAPSSPAAKNAFGIDIEPPPSPEPSRDFVMGVTPSSSPEKKHDFRLHATLSPSPAQEHESNSRIEEPDGTYLPTEAQKPSGSSSKARVWKWGEPAPSPESSEQAFFRQQRFVYQNIHRNISEVYRSEIGLSEVMDTMVEDLEEAKGQDIP